MDTAREEQHEQKQVEVVVKYVGEHPFRHAFPPAATFGEVKLAALRSFEIEPSAATKYVLTLKGVEVSDHHTLKELDQRKVDLELRLKEEVPKG